jgi:transcriptional regulator with XRE-family HTH domain
MTSSVELPDRSQWVDWLDYQVRRRGGLRKSAQEIGVSHSTLVRGLQGEPLSLSTLEGISAWSGVDLVRVIRLYGSQLEEDQQVIARVAILMDQYPQLQSTLATSLANLSQEDMLDIIEFIEFRASRSKEKS